MGLGCGYNFFFCFDLFPGSPTTIFGMVFVGRPRRVSSPHFQGTILLLVYLYALHTRIHTVSSYVPCRLVFLLSLGLTLQKIHHHKQLVEWIIPNFSPNVILDADMKLGGGFKYFYFHPYLGK